MTERGRNGRLYLRARWIVDDLGEIRLYRCCTRCLSWLERDVAHFTVRGRDQTTGRVTRWDFYCRTCRAAAVRETYRTDGGVRERQLEHNRRQRELAKADPERTAARRRSKREYARRVRHDPERARRRREAQARYLRRVYADPERHAAYVEAQRMRYRLRRQDAGYSPRRISTAAGSWTWMSGNIPTGERMPLEPFALWIDEVAATDQRDAQDIAALMGTSERRWRAYRHRQSKHVALGIADRALWGYGRVVRIAPERVAAALERLEAQWRAAPGNGSRLTGYLHDADGLIELAGAAVMRVEDLWPRELADA